MHKNISRKGFAQVQFHLPGLPTSWRTTSLLCQKKEEVWGEQQLRTHSFTCTHEDIRTKDKESLTSKGSEDRSTHHGRKQSSGESRRRTDSKIRTESDDSQQNPRRVSSKDTSDPSGQPSSQETWRDDMKEVDDIWYFSTGPDSDTDTQGKPKTKRLVKNTAGLVQTIIQKYLPSEQTTSLEWILRSGTERHLKRKLLRCKRAQRKLKKEIRQNMSRAEYDLVEQQYQNTYGFIPGVFFMEHVRNPIALLSKIVQMPLAAQIPALAPAPSVFPIRKDLIVGSVVYWTPTQGNLPPGRAVVTHVNNKAKTVQLNSRGEAVPYSVPWIEVRTGAHICE